MNMNMKELNIEELNMQIKNFVNQFKSGILGTLDLDGNVYLSALPVIKQNDKFFAYISRTAPHYDHLKSSTNVQIMFAEDESKMQNSFLRKRISFDCSTKFINDDESILEQIKDVHGNVVDMLRKLDFELIELQIIKGKAILGPGQACFINAQCEFVSQDVGKH